VDQRAGHRRADPGRDRREVHRRAPAAWLLLGPTDEGSSFSDSVDTDTINVAEFLSAIRNVVTGRTSKLSFALASWTLSNYRRAINGGIAAIAPTSAPPDPR
jgi:hypothetical protein